MFYKPPLSIIGPEAEILIPKAIQPVSKHLPDYEVELTVVIGKPCRNVSEADALDYVLGYMTGNDVRTSDNFAIAINFISFLVDVVPIPSNARLAMGFL